jgi:DNA-directed RNA polymerase I, II, and III subunit RPABC2
MEEVEDFFGEGQQDNDQGEENPDNDDNVEFEDEEQPNEDLPVKPSRLVKSRRPKVLTNYQYSRILSLRTEQIEAGKPIYIKIKKGEKLRPIEVAEREIKLKKLPFVVRLKYKDGSIEYHYLNDMIIPRNLR